MRIRDATPSDLPALQEIFRSASLSNAGDRALLAAHPEFLELTAESLATGRTRVAHDDDRIDGFATTLAVGDRRELDALFVHPDRMRQGIATTLVRDAVAQAGSDGGRALDVTGNEHARAFYHRVGFVQIGVVMTPGGVPAARLRLDIPEPR